MPRVGSAVERLTTKWLLSAKELRIHKYTYEGDHNDYDEQVVMSNTMFVVGATHPNELAEIRKIIPNHFILIPGVGAQGGDLKEISAFGLTKEAGLLVNVGRSIIYASKGNDFEEAAAKEAEKIHVEMKTYLSMYASS